MSYITFYGLSISLYSGSFILRIGDLKSFPSTTRSIRYILYNVCHQKVFQHYSVNVTCTWISNVNQQNIVYKDKVRRMIFFELNYLFQFHIVHRNSVWLSCIFKTSYQNSDFWYCNTPFSIEDKVTEHIILHWHIYPDICKALTTIKIN